MGTIAKAIMSGAIALGSGAGVSLVDGALNPLEAILWGVGVVVAFFGVWATTNSPTSAPASEAK